jgi:uncharacterized integral membrane protein
MNAKIVAILILILLAIILMFQNKEPVGVQLYFWSVYIPLVILMVIILLIGFAIGYVSASVKSRQKNNS